MTGKGFAYVLISRELEMAPKGMALFSDSCSVSLSTLIVEK
jgi:hypothetical protein